MVYRIDRERSATHGPFPEELHHFLTRPAVSNRLLKLLLKLLHNCLSEHPETPQDHFKGTYTPQQHAQGWVFS